MRQLFTWRFVAAVAALAALALVVNTVFVEGDDELVAVVEPAVIDRRIDLIAAVASVDTSDDFRVRRDGLTVGFADFTLANDRVMRVAPGTAADIDCDLTLPDNCAVFVDLLGEAVIWVAVRDKIEDGTVEIGRILDLEEGYALFETGWQIKYPPVIDRFCGDEDIVSFSDFLRRFGPGSITVIDIALQEVVRVRCAGESPVVPTTSTTLVTDQPVVPGVDVDTIPPDEVLNEEVDETVPATTAAPVAQDAPPVINE